MSKNTFVAEVNFEKPLPRGKNKNVISVMNDEFGGTILTEFAALKPKRYVYLKDAGCADKKANGTKKCVIKLDFKLGDCKTCLKNNKTVLKTQQKFRSETCNVFTEKVNKTALSANGDKKNADI